MTRESILLLLGIIIALSPWSGLPLAWLSWALVVLGLAVFIIGFTLRSRNAAPTVLDSIPVNAEPRATRMASS